MTAPFDVPRVSTGVAGLDDILYGGLPRDRMYLVEGPPGVGKTTLGLQFLLAGAEQGETGVYVTLSETAVELADVARSHGWSLGELTICDLQGADVSLKAESQYTLFHPSEIELTETTRAVLEIVERVRPQRVVFDSLSEVRLLARDSLRYRRQILALKQFFTDRGCTVLLLDSGPESIGEYQLESLAHGIIRLEMSSPLYGGVRRRLRVEKMRGSAFRDGYHDYRIVTGGLQVYPRLVAAEHRQPPEHEQVPSGVASLDALLGGGVSRGTSVMVMGPAGVGKSSLVTQYLVAAAARGERSVVYNFDESPASWLVRARGLGMDVEPHLAAGRITLHQVDPAEMSIGEFASLVRHEVEDNGVRFVVIDSLNGYRASMPEENFLMLHAHELLSFLAHRGIITFLVMAQHGILGAAIESPIEISYLADTVILLRYFEALGQVRQALSVLKKRVGAHERTIRELRLSGAGIGVGAELRDFQGVLTGTPQYLGGAAALAADDADRNAAARSEAPDDRRRRS
jgi:circadian clock protein KaiC